MLPEYIYPLIKIIEDEPFILGIFPLLFNIYSEKHVDKSLEINKM